MKKLVPPSIQAFLLTLTLCVTACSSTDEDCGGACGEGTVCDATTGQCILDDGQPSDNAGADECTTDSDCFDATLRCKEGSCVSKCEGVVCASDLGEVCDPTTGFCVGGRGCSSDEDCDENFLCDEGECRGGPFASCTSTTCLEGLNCINAPFGQVCLTPCTSYEECPLSQRCVIDPSGPIESIANHCMINFCRPGGDMFGFFQDAPYGGPCDADGEGDGQCVGPFLGGDGNLQGICLGADGPLTQGDACNPNAVHNAEDSCNRGLCVEEAGSCADYCSLFDEALCPTSTVCIPIWAANGVCITHNPGPLAEVGESCGDTPGALTCVEGSGCGPRGFVQGAENICLAYCLTDAQSGGQGTCESGTCTGYTEDNPTIGVCLE